MLRHVPGDSLEARCTRCNDTTRHVIVALSDKTILKVECQACGSVHKYSSPEKRIPKAQVSVVCRVRAGESRQRAMERKTQSSVSGRIIARGLPPLDLLTQTSPKRSTGMLSADEEREQAWLLAVNKSFATPKTYSAEIVFTENDILTHPTFGLGVVQKITPPDKITVIFREGIKNLRGKC